MAGEHTSTVPITGRTLGTACFGGSDCVFRTSKQRGGRVPLDDEVNQAFGLVHLFGPDPKTLFRTHANRLKNEGL